VFFRGNLQPGAAFVGHTAVARRASDHLPLIVDFQLAENA
jgi:endonuclease/exonuclease/phosphatase (EEP) superfamily protein YafD